MKKFFASLLLLSALGLPANAQQKADDKLIMQPAIGLYGGLNINMHSPSFSYVTNANDPLLRAVYPFTKSKTELGFNIGLIGYIPITEMFTISPRLGYNSMCGKLESNIVAGTARTTNEFDATLSYFEITPILQIHNLIPSVKNLYFLVGPEIGIPMTKEFTLSSTFVDPMINTPAVVTKMPEADIPDAGVRVAVAIGAGWMFELTDKWKLGAEVSYRIPVTKVSTNDFLDKWNVSQLRAGINITYDLFGKNDETKQEPTAATLEMSMGGVNSVTRDGTRSKMKTIRVEDMQYTELYPFINYVFFEENQAAPSDDAQVFRANSQSGQFSLSTLQPDAFEINRSSLDIIGTRMGQYPNANLTITGTIDNKKEKSNKAIAKERAEFAKGYLTTNYNVQEDRITTTGTGLPTKASSVRDPEGIAENRRIEFSSNEPRLFDPILITGENQRVATPDVVEFLPQITSSDSIAAWRLDLSQAGKPIKVLRGNSQPNSIQWTISPNELTNKEMPVGYTLSVTTVNGAEKHISGTIPVEYISISKKKAEELSDKTISKYSLVLFDFDKSDISASDMELINKQILPAIKFNSTVDIYGYTDRIGDDNYNQKLAEKRANAVKKVLSEKVNSATYNVHGVGESVSIFDNASPIGRHLSRTVQVYVSTPHGN